MTRRRAVAPGRRQRGASTQEWGSTRAERLRIPAHVLTVLEAQARRLYRRRHLQRAEQVARRVLEFDPARAYAWFVLGDIAMRQAQWQAALEHFERVLQCMPQLALARCRGGEALLEMGEPVLAARWFQEAIHVEAAQPAQATRRAGKFLAHLQQQQARQQQARPVQQQARARPARAPVCDADATQRLSEADFAVHRAQIPPDS